MGRPKKLVSLENIQNFQRELDLAGNNAEILLSDKKGRSRSCLLCRRRKQRCDRKQPSCTNCLKANVKCIQPARYNSTTPTETATASPMSLSSIDETTQKHFRPNGAPARNPNDRYTLYLENKIQSLENMLKKNESQMSMATHSNDGCESSASPPTGNVNGGDVMKTNNSSGSGSQLFNGNIGLNPNGRARLFGAVSTFKNSSPNSKDGKKNGTMLPALSSDSLESIDFSKCIFAKYNLKEFFQYDPAFEFDGLLSRSFLDTFFTRLQFKYPLLDEQEIYTFHEIYISNNVHAFSELNFHFACGRMWLVFAISACLFMTTGKYKGLPPVRYFSTAIRHITRCGQNLDNVQRVELLTLLVLYVLRTDRDSSVLYEIMKDVMGICKDNLHLNVWQPNDPNANKKLRIFWCVYLLERMICVAVGRPFTISESEINLPFFSEDSFNSGQGYISEQCHKRRGVHFINQSLKLRRIESQFVEHLQILPLRHNRKETLREQLPTVRKFFHDLEVWRSSCSRDDVRNFENETLKLYYYRSVRLLIQPYLEFITPDDRLFRECQAAAGQICQLYKIFHQKTLRGHSTPAIHTVFIAGVTLIYCMWLARNFDDEKRKRLGDDSKHTRPSISASLFSTMDDLRACSVCLYVMTERSNFARTFRDTFDELMNATVGNLIERCGPNSSELIHLSTQEKFVNTFDHQAPISYEDERERGMPPATNRTFGKRQAEEHVGFVEISQVDPEEQKEFKRKQDVLEETSVPKSLAHLLIKVGDKGKTGDAHHDQRGKIERNKYIVQKPANSAEFDWESFQQQAFVQQHMAKENLKAYLSALKYNGSGKSPTDHAASSIFASALPEQSISASKNVQAPVKTEQAEDRGGIGRAMPSMSQMMPQIVSNTTTNSNSPNSLLNEGILFNNGTHDMINDISTWTNDSVVNKNHQYAPIDFNSQDTLSFLPDEDEFLPQIRATDNQSQANAINRSPNVPGPPLLNTYVNSQDRFIGSSNIGHSSSETDQDRKRRHLVPSTTGRGGIAEKFWTVNDDYGFLT